MAPPPASAADEPVGGGGNKPKSMKPGAEGGILHSADAVETEVSAESGAAIGAPTSLALKKSNCSSMTLTWRRPTGSSDDDVLEYEVATSPVSTSHASHAPFAIAGVHSMEYEVDNLRSSTDYTFRVRARTDAGWGSLGPELVGRTNPPSRVLPPPKAPARVVTNDDAAVDDCARVELKLPKLRKGCASDTALSLEYRAPGRTDWIPYEHPALLEENLERLRVTLAPTGVRGGSGSADFRLRAHRGPLVSEPSEVLPGIEGCDVGPMRSSRAVLAALGIAMALLLLFICCMWRATRSKGDDGFSIEMPPSRSRDMTRVKTHDEEDEVSDEINVRYELTGGGRPIEGMLPLAGIETSDELLEELAEFGCELQDEVILSVRIIEAWYEDRHGKSKQLGPRTPLREVIDAGEVTVMQVAGGGGGGGRAPGRAVTVRAPKRAVVVNKSFYP